MTLPLTLGYSSCPNDTFVFDALAHERIATPFSFSVHMADVEELNIRARGRGTPDADGAGLSHWNDLASAPRLDVTKLSMAAAAHVLEEYVLLNAGSALGRGCGPLLVARRSMTAEELQRAPIAVPGTLTTANALLSLNGSFQGPRLPMIFDQVMPALENGRAELGLIIHEGRFTYAERGLRLVLDLGAWWEERTGLPLPLGVIAARRALGPEVIGQIDDAVRHSVLHARSFPGDAMPYIRAHAQEMDEQVMLRHIETFVNEFTVSLGREGQQAVTELLSMSAKLAGITLPSLPFFADFG